MREGVGLVFSLQIIFIFILLINGYMAYSVNYTRAFRVKNKIIDIIEESEGWTSSSGVSGNSTQAKVSTYINQIGYGASQSLMNFISSHRSDYSFCSATDGYCFSCKAQGSTDINADDYHGVVYTVTTWVDMDIPIFNKLLPLQQILDINGSTRTIYHGTCPR